MFLTARQLEALHRENGANGQLVLPYWARLTPAAQDWVRLKKVTLGYSDEQTSAMRGRTAGANGGGSSAAGNGVQTGEPAPQAAEAAPAGAMLWWCDGPCGAAKAAITAQAKESLLRAVEIPADAKQIVAVVKTIARELKAGTAANAAIVVQNAAAAMVFANRCPSIRAVVGTCLEAVEQGIQQVAANVLVIEHPYKTLQQVKNMLARFAKAKRELTPDVQRQLAELASCS